MSADRPAGRCRGPRLAVYLLTAIGVALIVACVGTAAGPALATAASRPAPPPPGFFGVVPQAPPGRADFRRMRGTVETMRIPIYWFEVEPRKGRYDFATVDREIAGAARVGIEVLPFVYGTPGWVGRRQSKAPLGPRQSVEWKRFLRVLVDRYGDGGSFWIGRARRLPVRRWQIWNEPNFRLFWAPRIEPAGYARLLRASATAIRAADPAAKIVLAGIAPVGAGMKTWVFMRRLLRVPGIEGDFDFAALHPYSSRLVELEFQLNKVRAAMAAGGARRKPLIVTEFGVASHGDYPSAFIEGEAGEADFLEQAYTRLLRSRRRWHLAGAYWYTWKDEAGADPHCSFCQGAGLVDLAGKPKAAWDAYRAIASQDRRNFH